MIDPRFSTLRVFSSTGSVARTAELTGYSPSAVSAQLRELQRSLGIKLIAMSKPIFASAGADKAE